jgi:riboflavin kinase/FMN adenylyltransferase
VVVVHYPDEARPARWSGPVVAIGNFDGVHRGHLKLIERIREGAHARGTVPVVLTFDPHPPRVLRPDKAPPLLMTREQKAAALEAGGVAGLAVVRFSAAMATWEPEQFVRRVLVDWLRASEVWVGADFLFGRNRSGTFSLLRTLGQQWGYRAEKVDPVRYRDFIISSTRIRRLLTEGRVDEASALLGRHYSVVGEVVAGQQRGRLLGFPTANLATSNELVPLPGVYATLVSVDGHAYRAVTNIGVRPTFGDGLTMSVESHLLGASLDLYGRTLSVAFVQRLRDEQRFADVDALRGQIAADVAQAVRLFDKLSV